MTGVFTRRPCEGRGRDLSATSRNKEHQGLPVTPEAGREA